MAPKPRRRLGPQRQSRKAAQDEDWENIGEDDLLTLPASKPDAEEAGDEGAELWHCEPWATEDAPCFLVPATALIGIPLELPDADACEALCAACEVPPRPARVPRKDVASARAAAARERGAGAASARVEEAPLG